MNDVVKFGSKGLPMSPDALLQGLQNTSRTIQSGDTLPLLRLGKGGYFIYGQDDIEVEPDSLWALNPASLKHGYACWGDGELLGEVMVPFNQPLPALAELPNYGEKWGQQIAVQLQCLTGEDKGVVVNYKGTSLGLRNAMRELINELIVQLQSDPQNCVPVIAFEVDSYKHKTYGKVFTPVLNIERWISYDGEESPPDADAKEDPPARPSEAKRSADRPVVTPRRTRGAAAKTDESLFDKTEADEPEEPEEADEPAPRSRRSRGAAAETSEPAPTATRRRRRG